MYRECELCQFVSCCLWFVLRIVSMCMLLYLELLVLLNENQSELEKKSPFLFRHKLVSTVE